MIPILGLNPSLNLSLQLAGRVFLHVNAASGSDAQQRAPNRAFRTIQNAVDRSNPGDAILVSPGAYDETVTIARGKGPLVIIGIGGRGGAYIEPSTEDAGGMVVHSDDVTLINLGVAAEDATSAAALTVTGSRFRAYGCKFEGGAKQIVLGPGTVTQVDTAGTHGNAGDALFDDCEICWGTHGVFLTATNYGAVTQARFTNCLFHNLSASSFEETGGTVSIRYRNLNIVECVFAPMEDGTIPTKFVSLNDDNGNFGVVARCTFPTAINSGKNLGSTGLLWVSNFHTGGVSAAQPS